MSQITTDENTPPSAARRGIDEGNDEKIAKSDAAMSDGAQYQGMVGALGATVQGLQHTLASTYKSMMGNLSQSVHMMTMMNAMMEDFVRRSVVVNTHLSSYSTSAYAASQPAASCSGKVLVKMTVQNLCRFPLANVSLHLRFHTVERGNTDDGSAPVFNGASLHTSAQNDLRDGAEKKVPMLEDLARDDDGLVVAQQINLEAEASAEWLLVLSPPSLARYNGTAVVTFPSPGTAEVLRNEHNFGVYLLHQTHLAYSANPPPASLPLSDVGQTELKSVTLREVFRVKATQGIGMNYSFVVFRTKDKSPSDSLVALTVVGVLDDGEQLVLRMQQGGQASALTAAAVAEELGRL